MFAPIVISLRQLFGKAKFNKIRGKGIALHSQVINAYCKRFGIETKTRQSLIRQARDNGKKLGLLA